MACRPGRGGSNTTQQQTRSYHCRPLSPYNHIIYHDLPHVIYASTVVPGTTYASMVVSHSIYANMVLPQSIYASMVLLMLSMQARLIPILFASMVVPQYVCASMLGSHAIYAIMFVAHAIHASLSLEFSSICRHGTQALERHLCSRRSHPSTGIQRNLRIEM